MVTAEMPMPPAGDRHDAPAAIVVEVAWSPAPRETLATTLRLAPGVTVAGALRASGWPAFVSVPDDDEAFGALGLSVAIWGRARPLSHVLRDGDRLEVLRELQVGPMDARRARFEAAGGVDALRKRGYAGRKR
jgi:putative ubiquitin-RnfH superfamily antitoxin RatB of RatAB toxin-antitoxin module